MPYRPNDYASLLIAAAVLVAGCGEPLEDDDTPEDAETFCGVTLEETQDQRPEPVHVDPASITKVEASSGDLAPRFEPGGEGFYRMPWPSDGRLTDQGTVDISDIPHSEMEFMQRYEAAIDDIEGFSMMPVAYIPFSSDKAPSEDAVPTPKQSLEQDAPIQLIDLSEEHCGQRVPVESSYDEEGDRFIDPHVLKVAPVPGFALHHERTYAFVVTTDFGQPDGLSTARTQAFADHLNLEGPEGRLTDSFHALRNCLPEAGLDPAKIAMASVFTTHNPVRETRLMRQVVWCEETKAPEILEWKHWSDHSTDHYKVFKGTMSMPAFQKGDPPYSTKDGGLEFDEHGLPIIQKWEKVPFAVTVPAAASGPLPLLIWEDGTGARLTSHLGDDHITGAASKGFAVASFVAPFHEGREFPGDPTRDTFNYLNPESGRTVFRQQIAETSYFMRMLVETLSEQPGAPRIDTAHIVYGGHSQGALVGAMTAGVEPNFDAFVLNGVGGYLSNTVIFRKDPFDIAGLVQSMLQIDRPIDRFHPVVQMAQLGADAVDPQNYARSWYGWERNPDGANVFMINGKKDDTTSTTSMNALLAIADVPSVGDPGWDVDPWGLREELQTEAPVKKNRQSDSETYLTMGAYLTADQGHFTIYNQTRARRAAVGFWDTALRGVPAIDL